jgi:hypothetical protein
MKYFYTLLFAALPYIIFAQTDYHEGYIIKNNGDTLKGFISRHDWVQNPKSINFKENMDDRQSVNFTAGSVKEFWVSGETYVTYKGMISMDKNKFPDLPLGLDTDKKTDTIFLRLVVKGKYLALFYHQDFLKTRFFIADANAQPVELEYYQYYDNVTQLAVKAYYKGQLLFYIDKYMPGSPKLGQKAEDTKFDQTDLAGMTSAINGDNNSVKKGAYSRFFIGGGVNSIQSHFRDNNELIDVFTTVGPITEVDRYAEKISKFSTITSPRLNAGIDVFTNPEVQKLIFRGELSFSYNSPKFQYMIAGAGTNINQIYSFDQYTATVTPQIILNRYNKNNFKVYIDGGIGINFSAYSNTHLSKGAASDLQSFWVNFPIGAGIAINKKVEISLSYAAPASLVNYFDYFGVDSRYMSLGLKYLLNAH